MVCCDKILKDHLIGHPDTIQVNAFLPANTALFWEISDAQGNVYNLPFTTNERGIGSIDATSILLPEGLFNPYIGILSIKVKRLVDDTRYIDLIFLNTVNQININVEHGSGTKSQVGESIPDNIGMAIVPNPVVNVGALTAGTYPITWAGQGEKYELRNSDNGLPEGTTATLLFTPDARTSYNYTYNAAKPFMSLRALADGKQASGWVTFKITPGLTFPLTFPIQF